MAKAKVETPVEETVVEQTVVDNSTVDNLQKLLNEQKDANKKLEEEKVSLVAKLQHLESQETLIADLKETVADLHKTRDEKVSENEALSSQIANFKEDINLYQTEISKLKSILPADVVYSDSGEYKYKVGQWVRYVAAYQNLRFEVRQRVGIGSNGPLYRLYQYDHDITLNNILESELQPAINVFRHE